MGEVGANVSDKSPSKKKAVGDKRAHADAEPQQAAADSSSLTSYSDNGEPVGKDLGQSGSKKVKTGSESSEL